MLDPMITVLIATYNGAKTLPEVLKAYCMLRPPDGGWRLVIVDNGSTDETREIVDSFAQRLPLSYVLEPRKGKNVALNTGLSGVSGDLVVFTDDDVLPQPDWLKQIRSVADSQPSFSIFGGPILPKWDFPPDDWILQWVPMGPTFSILKSREEGPINPLRVFGGNMAVRTDILRSGYRFDETIGPKGSYYAMGSENELLRRLAKAGFTAWHCSGAVVYHIIRSFQMSKEWVLGRAIRYGRGEYRRAEEDHPKGPASLFGTPVILLAQIAVQGLRIGRARCIGNAEKIFKARWHLRYLIGNAKEARLMHKESAASPVSRRLECAD